MTCGLRRLALLSLALPTAAIGGVGTMSSTPIWDLADHGGARAVSSASPLEAPNSAIPNFSAFTVEARITFGAFSDKTAFTLFDQIVTQTGWGLVLVRDANSGSPIYLKCNGQSYNCAQALGNAANGSTHTFTVAVRDGWVVVYMDGSLKKRFMMTVVPNLAPVRVGAPAPSGWGEHTGVTLQSLKIWGEGEKFYASGEPQDPADGYVGGNGWLIEAPTHPDPSLPDVLCLGDSISEGYKPQLKPLLSGKANLYHWSTFFTTAGAAGIPSAKIAEVCAVADFDHIVFNNGLHSLGWTESSTTDAKVRESYAALAAAFASAAPRARLHYLATTPHTGKKGSGNIVTTLGDKNPVVLRLNRFAREVAEERGFAYADAYALLVNSLEWAAGDQFHWTAAAYARLAAFIAAEIGMAAPASRTYSGTDGVWAKASNWSPQGIPSAGETAVFAADATITGPVALDRTVTMDVASGTTLTISGSISGAGGIVKTGEGTIVVSGNNSFTGSFVVSNGTAKARSPNALGDNASGNVEIRAINRATKLYLGGVHVRKKLILHNRDDPSIGYQQFFQTEANTTNVVSGPVSIPGHYLRMRTGSNSSLDFLGGPSFGNNSAFLFRDPGSELHVAVNAMRIVNRYEATYGDGWLVLDAPGCEMADVSSETQQCIGNRRTTVDGALAASSVVNGGGDKYNRPGTLDLAGTRQTIKRLFGRHPSCGGTVTSRTPALLTLTDTAHYTNTCAFTGQASLTLSGASANSVVLTGASTGDGILTVEAGKKAVFALGGSWRGGIVVKGTLEAADAAAVTNAAFVDVRSGGSLVLPAGANTFRQYRVDGVAQSGGGVTRTYVGTDGKWTAPANWSPAGVPGSGDTALFTSSRTIAESFVLPGGATKIAESAAGVTVTFSGAIGGAEAALVHNGPGMMVLSGTNTFTGAFTNLAGTAKVPWLANAGEPSPIGAAAGGAAKIFNNGTFHVTGTCTTDRPYHGGGASQWNLDGTVTINAPVSGTRTWWRNNGNLVVNGLCTSIGALSRTDGGTIHMNCPSNTFAGNVDFCAGKLHAASIANAGAPSAVGAGSAMRFGQSNYRTPVTFAYTGATDAECDRAINIYSYNQAAYSQKDGLTLITARSGAKARYAGPISLMNSDAPNPFLIFDGPGDVEIASSIPHRFHIEKKGAGTLTLSGANAATGVCTVAAGRLDVNGSLAAGMALNVQLGATVGGTGVVASAASFAAGSSIAVQLGGEAEGCLAFTGATAFPASLAVRAETAGRIRTGEHALLKWRAAPACAFTLSGAHGALEKRADGLYLIHNSPEDMLETPQSGAEPYGIDVSHGSALSTPAAARDRISALRAVGAIAAERPVVVRLAPGDYVMSAPLELSANDSGSRAAPVIWRGPADGGARLLGSAPIDKARFAPVSSSDPNAARLPAESLPRIIAADVSDLLPASLPEWPSAKSGRMPPLPILFLGGRFQEIARWPNRASEDSYGWTAIPQCTFAGNDDGSGIRIVTPDDRPSRWNFSEGVWLYGYWGNTWYDEVIAAVGWNAATKELTIGKVSSGYTPQPGSLSGLKYVALNIPEELDAPGEWWLDRDARRLYYLPPDGFEREELAMVSAADTLVSFSAGAHDIRFEGIEFAYASRAFSMPDGSVSRVAFDSCSFHSFIDFSSINGADCSVRRSSFAHFAKGALSVNGGSRQALASARNVVEGCSFTDFERLQQTYAPAVSISQGCGNAVRGCSFSKSSHEAIGYGGNEHLIGWSDFSEVLRESEDCGAIYTGRNTTPNGTVIVRCDFRDINTGNVTGIYFDDCDWGDDAYCCTFTNVYRAFLVGGGNLHRLEWNEMRDGHDGFYVDHRGVVWANRDWMAATTNWWWNKFAEDKINPNLHPWTAAYPALVPTLNDTPDEPWNNVLQGNLIQDHATWTTLRASTTPTTFAAATNGITILNNVTASTKGKAGTGFAGFTHLMRAATSADVPGMDAAFARANALASAPSHAAASPDGALSVRVGLDPAARLSIRSEYNGEAILDLSPIGVTVDGTDHGRMMAPCAGAAVRAVAGEMAVPEASAAGYTEMVVPLEDVVHGGTNAQAEVRAFANGLAWRMCVFGAGERVVAGEMARWNVAGGVSCSPIPTEGWTCQGEVVTPWHVAVLAAPAVTNGILYIDVPAGNERALSPMERRLLMEDSVTGAVKTGGGTLVLDVPVTGYTGPWDVDAGFITVTAAADAFGSSSDARVRVVTTNGSGGWGLSIAAAAVIARPVAIVCDDYRSLYVDRGVQARFTKSVTATGKNMRFNVESGGSAVLSGGFVNNASLTCTGGSGEMVFEGAPSSLVHLYAQHSSKIRFNCPGNTVKTITCAFSDAGQISLGCAGALSGYTAMKVQDTKNYVIDLAGHDMATGNFGNFTSGELASSAPGGYLRVKETGRVTNENCRVTGDLTFSKTGSGEFAFARLVESTGALEVDQGILRMTRQASWPNVRRVSVTGTGTLIVEGDDPFGDSPKVAVSGNGRIQVAAGSRLTCGELKVDGHPLGSGTYRSGSFISGGGEIVVRPHPGTVFVFR